MELNFKMVKGTQIGKDVPHGGIDPVPATTNQIIKYGSNKGISWFPSAHYIAMIEVAVHEYAGMGWTALGGR